MGDTIHHADSRRDFIRGSSLLLAGAVPAALATAAEAASKGHRPRPKFRLGLIGCGYRGTTAATTAARSSAAEVAIVALADVFGDRLQQASRSLKGKCGEQFQVPSQHRFVGFDAYRKLLELDLDAVILATPPGFRPVHFQAAIEAGKHVYAERPVAVDAPGIRMFLAASEMAQERRLGVAVGLQRRHSLACRETIEQIHLGAIGDVSFARAYCTRPAPRMQPRRKGNQPELEYQLRNWQHFQWAGGASIVEQHVQSLDAINWVLDDHPVEAQGIGGWQNTSPPSGTVFDHHSVEFGYRNGVRLLSMNGWSNDSHTEIAEWVHGSKGVCDLTRGKIYDHRRQLVWKAENASDGLQSAMDSFWLGLASGNLPCDGEFAAESTMTAIMGRQATLFGKRMEWNACLADERPLADFSAFRSPNDPVPNSDA